MIRHVTIVQGKRAVYWERNPERTQTMVLLHGFRGNHKGLTDIAQELDEYRLIIPDLPGYGESESLLVEHTLANYAEWLDQFVAAVGLDDWISWGHSYSAAIALIQAADGAHKPSALIGVSLAAVRDDAASMAATFYYWFGAQMPKSMQRHWVASRLIDHATGRWLFKTVTARRRAELVRRGDHNLQELDPRVVTEEYMSSLTTDLVPYADTVTMPVLIIAGAKDVIVPVARLADLVARMPNGQLSVMRDEGHLGPMEEPATCATLTLKFLHLARIGSVR